MFTNRRAALALGIVLTAAIPGAIAIPSAAQADENDGEIFLTASREYSNYVSAATPQVYKFELYRAGDLETPIHWRESGLTPSDYTFDMGTEAPGDYTIRIVPESSEQPYAPTWLGGSTDPANADYVNVPARTLIRTSMHLALDPGWQPQLVGVNGTVENLTGTYACQLAYRPGCLAAVHDDFNWYESGVATSNASVTVHYQWTRNGHPIPGATSSTYRMITLDVNTRLGVTVYGTKAGDRDSVPRARASNHVSGVFVRAVSLPRVTTSRDGSRASFAVASPTRWSTPHGSTVYHWLIDGKRVTSGTRFATSNRGVISVLSEFVPSDTVHDRTTAQSFVRSAI